MYITKNLYERYAQFIDLSDIDFFHQSIEIAKDLFSQGFYEDKTNEEIKSQFTPVVYASSIASQLKEENYIARIDMNDRARRKYLVIDADFDSHQQKESSILYNRLIHFSDRFNTPIVIFPTISYPGKPRFRAVLFTKRVMDENSYWQAMHWLYDQLETTPTDEADYNIRSNTNAPVFINQKQIDDIFDTTHEENQPLDNSLWKSYPKKKSIKTMSKSDLKEYDLIPVDKDMLTKWSEYLIVNSLVDDYMDCFKIISSTARSVITGQISQSEAENFVASLANSSKDESIRSQWSKGNIQSLRSNINYYQRNATAYNKTIPITAVKSFKESIYE